MNERDDGMVSVDREILVPASSQRVWESLTDASLLSIWMGDEVEIDPRVGGSVTLTPDSGERVWGTVEEVIENRRIQWSWRTDHGLPSLIEFELAPGADDSETIVTVRETLLPWRISGPGGSTDWPQASAVAITAA